MPKILIPASVQQKLADRTKTDDPNQHWFYPGSGKLAFDGSTYRARALWWAILIGDGSYPARMENHCGNRNCCNPKHWFDASNGIRKPNDQISDPHLVEEIKFHKGNGKYYVCNYLTAGKQLQLGRDHAAAIQLWKVGRPMLEKGLYWKPSLKKSAYQLTVGQLCSLFEIDLEIRQEESHLSREYFKAMLGVCKRIVKHFGQHTLVSSLNAENFDEASEKIEINKRNGALRAWEGYKTECNNWRTVFLWAVKKKRIPLEPDYGQNFPVKKKPYERRANRLRQINGKKVTAPRKKLFARHEIESMLACASTETKALIYVGINLAIENKQLGFITASDFVCDDHNEWWYGWYEERRIKTSEPRKSHVWPETIEAIKQWMKDRPVPSDPEFADVLFLNKSGGRLRGGESNTTLCDRMREVMVDAGCYQEGRGFYGFRHTFSTIAGGACDLQAKEYIMGHSTPAKEFAPQSASYDHAMANKRLKHVSLYVRDWLNGNGEESKPRKIVKTLADAI